MENNIAGMERVGTAICHEQGSHENASAVSYIANVGSDYITGMSFVINGGQYLLYCSLVLIFFVGWCSLGGSPGKFC